LRRTALSLLIFLAANISAAAAPRTLDLAIGDPARRERQAPVVLDAITDSRTGEALTPDELAARLDPVRLLVIGEEHTSAESHRIQLALLEALARRGRPLLVGLEMFPAPAQESLDRWNGGWLTEEGFVRLGGWYENWGFPWGYYRDLFLFARREGIPFYAVNAPREVVTAVRKKGFAGLTPEEAAQLPARVVTEGEEFRTLFRSYFEGGAAGHGGMGGALEDGLIAAQATWDAAMARNALRALAEHGKPESLMVVLAGSGHAAYGMGIERQAAAQGFTGKSAAVIPVVVRGEDGKPVAAVRASYADFVWGVAPEEFPRFPSLGVSTAAATDAGKPALRVLFVEEGSAAARAGLAGEDVILTLDGQPISSREAWSRTLGAKAWGDRVLLTVRRGERVLPIAVELRRWSEQRN
jgi:uncharacterized iron-regulated protein